MSLENDGYIEVVPAYQFEGEATSEHGEVASKRRLVNQINPKFVYKHIMNDPLYRNSIFNMTSIFIMGGLGFVFWILIARLYKAENVGIATTLISIMTLLSSLTILGLGSTLIRYLPTSVNKNELINSSFVIVTFATIVVSLIFFLGLQQFSPKLFFLRSNLIYFISFTIFVIFSSWNILVESIFLAFRSAEIILMKNIIIGLLKLILPFALVAFGAYGIFASNAASFALGVLICLVILIYKFKVRPSIIINFSLLKATSLYSSANYIVAFVVVAPSLILPVIILNTLSAQYVAYYYVASMIQSILVVIPVATEQALLIEGSYNEYNLKKHVAKAIAIIFALLIPAIGIVVFAGNIILQLFGKSYAIEAFQFLQLYSISTLFSALLLVTNAILNIKHKIKILVIFNVLTAVLTLFLSCAFISNKLVGIGWGWLLGQAIAGSVSIYFIIHNCSSNLQTRASKSRVKEVLKE